jgi:hypothetical protein
MKDIYIGTIYGQAGFNWMVEEIIKKFSFDNIIYFAVGLIPWIARTFSYGKIGYNYGPKKVNVVAISKKDSYDYLNANVLESLCYNFYKVGKFKLSENFISLTLSVDNQIIHLSRLYCLFKKYNGKWESKDSVPLFYKDYDDSSADMLRNLDNDYEKIRKSIISLFPNKNFEFMLDYLNLERLSYGSANTDIKGSFVTSETLGQISTPVVKNRDGFWIIDKNHRFFTDDLYYGLTVAKWFAEKLQVDTPTLDSIIYWSQEFLGDNFLVGGKLDISLNDLKSYKFGVPSSYGYNEIIEVID